MKEGGAGHSKLKGPPGGEQRGEGAEEDQTHGEGCGAGDTEHGADGDPGKALQLCFLTNKFNGETKGKVE